MTERLARIIVACLALASAADRQQSDTRPREELWEQQVRNIVSHRNTPGNFIHEGRLAHTPGRLALTPAGHVYAGTL